jgi:hypothetical protein
LTRIAKLDLSGGWYVVNIDVGRIRLQDKKFLCRLPFTLHW